MMSEIKPKLREIILIKFLPDESPENLTDEMELLESGILDSMGVISLVSHIEQEFDVEFGLTDISFDNFNSINSIAALIESKR